MGLAAFTTAHMSYHRALQPYRTEAAGREDSTESRWLLTQGWEPGGTNQPRAGGNQSVLIC